MDGTIVDAMTLSDSKEDEARWVTIPQIASKFTDVDTLKPSYYGDFMVADGNLIELKENRIQMVGTFSEAVWGIKSLSGISITDSKPYFIIYQQIPAGTLGMIKLTKLKFVERMQFKVPLGPPQTGDVNMWIADQSQEIKLRVAPVQGESDMYRLVPASVLSTGIYALHTGNLYHKGQFPMGFDIADFTVKSGVDSQTLLQHAERAEQGNLTLSHEPKSKEILLKQAIDAISYRLGAQIVNKTKSLVD